MGSFTPIAQSPYSRVMAAPFDERLIKVLPTGFQSLYGAQPTWNLFSPDALQVSADIRRGDGQLAKMIHRGQSSPIGSGYEQNLVTKFTNVGRVFPLIEDSGPVTSDQLHKRAFGVSEEAQETYWQRLQRLAAEQHATSFDKVVRTFEKLAAQAALTGAMDAIIGTSDTTEQFDFYRNTDNTFAADNAWDAAADAGTPFTDLEAMAKVLLTNGKIPMDYVVVSAATWAAMFNNAQITTLADEQKIKFFDAGMIAPPARYARMIANGFNPVGFVRLPSAPEVFIFTYLGTYDVSGTATQYMPDGQAFCGSSLARADRQFGPADRFPDTQEQQRIYQLYFGFAPTAPNMQVPGEDVTAVIQPWMFYLDAMFAPDKKSLIMRTQAAPLYVPTHTDAFGLLTGLLTA
jgi:hypothetical protein